MPEDWAASVVIRVLTELCQRVLDGEVMQEDWATSCN